MSLSKVALMTSVDVFIIGGGHGGLSAALGLSRLLYTTMIFDSEVYRNAISHHMHNVPSWDHRNPADFREAARKELLMRYQTNSFLPEKVERFEKLDDGMFKATTESRLQVTGKKVVIASGLKDIFPDIPGYSSCWGKSIYHCLFCHGYEERDQDDAGVLVTEDMANSSMALGVAGMVKRLSKKTTIYTNQNLELVDVLHSESRRLGFHIDNRKILRLEQRSKEESAGITIYFDDGATAKVGFLAHSPKKQVNGPWKEQMGLEMTPLGEIKVNGPLQESSVHGVFAVGDCSIAYGSVTIAIASGARAAGGIAHQLGLEA